MRADGGRGPAEFFVADSRVAYRQRDVLVGEGAYDFRRSPPTRKWAERQPAATAEATSKRQMANVTQHAELIVRIANDPASLGKLMAVVGSCGVEILAACSYWDHAGAVMMLVTNDTQRTIRALAAAGFECKSSRILLVEARDKPGLAAWLGSKLLAADIGVVYSYTFRSERNLSYLVFKTTDDDRAMDLLGFEALLHELAEAKRPYPLVPAEVVGPETEPCAV